MNLDLLTLILGGAILSATPLALAGMGELLAEDSGVMNLGVEGMMLLGAVAGFLAVLEATEEAVYNSLLRATTVTGRGHTVQALPLEKTTEILRRYGAIK